MDGYRVGTGPPELPRREPAPRLPIAQLQLGVVSGGLAIGRGAGVGLLGPSAILHPGANGRACAVRLRSRAGEGEVTAFTGRQAFSAR